MTEHDHTEAKTSVLQKAGTFPGYAQARTVWEQSGSSELFDFTDPVVLKQPVWADPVDPRQVDFTQRLAHAGPFSFDAKGRPVNPYLPAECADVPEGRGILGKWGPNFAADPIITRISPAGSLEVLLVQRKDGGGWAIPGGMVDPGEQMSETALRELREEALHTDDPEERRRVDDALKEISRDPQEVYRGPVDDPRNTKNSWMFTSAFHFHLPPAFASQLRPKAGSDAKAVQWVDVERLHPSHPAHLPLYASHAHLVRQALASMIEESERVGQSGEGAALTQAIVAKIRLLLKE